MTAVDGRETAEAVAVHSALHIILTFLSLLLSLFQLFNVFLMRSRMVRRLSYRIAGHLAHISNEIMYIKLKGLPDPPVSNPIDLPFDEQAGCNRCGVVGPSPFSRSTETYTTRRMRDVDPVEGQMADLMRSRSGGIGRGAIWLGCLGFETMRRGSHPRSSPLVKRYQVPSSRPDDF